MKRWGLRTRAAVFWGVGFVVLGVALLTLLASLIQARIGQSPQEATALIVEGLGFEIDALDELTVTDPSGNSVAGDQIRLLLQQVASQTRDDVSRWVSAAIPLLAVVGALAGWWLAGRAVVPVTEMTAKARRVSSERLDTRISLEGPEDEVKELADAFDSMMERLERAFETQGRFAAFASHELRTPLALIRTELDVALDQHDPSRMELIEMAEAIRSAIARSENVIDSLLVFARSGIVEAVSPVEVGSVVNRILDDLTSEINARRIRVVKPTFDRAVVRGDEILIERMLRNLLTNAVLHNVPEGQLEVDLSLRNGDIALRVANTGRPIDPETVDRLVEPFYRGEGGSRVPGSGLGLTIAASIADAHGTVMQLAARPKGGITVELLFPASPQLSAAP